MMLFRCTGCGHVLFPRREMCARCGGSAWEDVACEAGRIEAVTPQFQLASVRGAGGVIVLARLEAAAAAGERVSLHESPDGAVIARRLEEPR